MATYDELIDNLVNVVKEKAFEVFDREKEDDDFLKHTFLGSKWRATKGIFIILKNSFKPMVKILALSIADHRLCTHGQNNQKEVDKLKRSMSDDEIKASTRGWGA
jgi:hypothetical protein